MFNCNCVYKNINSNCISSINSLPNFYANIIKTWFKTKQVYQTSEIRDVGNEIIWNNESIKLNNNHWSRRFPQHIFNWKQIWRASSKCTHEAKLITLNWKIIHNIYPTKIMLYKMGKEPTNLCNTCNVIDYTEHFFFSCNKVNTVWQYASDRISIFCNISFKFNVENVLFGVYSFNDNTNKLINHVSAIVKHCIRKFKYGNHPNLLVLVEGEIRICNVMIN